MDDEDIGKYFSFQFHPPYKSTANILCLGFWQEKGSFFLEVTIGVALPLGRPGWWPRATRWEGGVPIIIPSLPIKWRLVGGCSGSSGNWGVGWGDGAPIARCAPKTPVADSQSSSTPGYNSSLSEYFRKFYFITLLS